MPKHVYAKKKHAAAAVDVLTKIAPSDKILGNSVGYSTQY